jgi:hypothetical protein
MSSVYQIPAEKRVHNCEWAQEICKVDVSIVDDDGVGIGIGMGRDQVGKGQRQQD